MTCITWRFWAQMQKSRPKPQLLEIVWLDLDKRGQHEAAIYFIVTVYQFEMHHPLSKTHCSEVSLSLLRTHNRSFIEISTCLILGKFDEKVHLSWSAYLYKEDAFCAIKATIDLIITWRCRRGLRVLKPEGFILDGFSQNMNKDEQKRSEYDKPYESNSVR